ncbi:hypothetical protein CB1_000880019 [Camelus ferus]|nr:hypothetical protein CB1_000880019 [Camelus ferus]
MSTTALGQHLEDRVTWLHGRFRTLRNVVSEERTTWRGARVRGRVKSSGAPKSDSLSGGLRGLSRVSKALVVREATVG